MSIFITKLDIHTGKDEAKPIKGDGSRRLQSQDFAEASLFVDNRIVDTAKAALFLISSMADIADGIGVEGIP